MTAVDTEGWTEQPYNPSERDQAIAGLQTLAEVLVDSEIVPGRIVASEVVTVAQVHAFAATYSVPVREYDYADGKRYTVADLMVARIGRWGSVEFRVQASTPIERVSDDPWEAAALASGAVVEIPF